MIILIRSPRFKSLFFACLWPETGTRVGETRSNHVAKPLDAHRSLKNGSLKLLGLHSSDFRPTSLL